MKNTSQLFRKASVALVLTFSAGTAFAGSIATEELDTGGLTLSPNVSYDSATLRVSSDTLDVTRSYGANESIRVDSGTLADGIYYYELALNTAASEQEPNGSPVTQTGDFLVQSGSAAETVAALNAQAEAERLQAVASSQLDAELNADSPTSPAAMNRQ